MTEQLTPFSKEGDQYLSIYFLPQLLPRKWNESLSFFRFQFTYKKLKLRLLWNEVKKWQENVINAMELVAVITVKDQARKTIQDMENQAMIPASGVMGVEFANGAAEEVNAENF